MSVIGVGSVRSYPVGMRVGTVDLPDELVNAHSEGRLVLFVGAGASVAEPSGLPTFERLAQMIGDDVGCVYPGDASSPDVFLGNLKGEEVDVHLMVHSIIDSPESEPTDLHRAIARLASTSGNPRIVTTNYDRHLSTCPPVMQEFVPSALPTVESFTGIVYLHGSVGQKAENLVVTEADLGRAYLAEGWAARFIRMIFGETVVLFIGYSHRDTLMKYLAKGLPDGTRRYALDKDPEDPQWRELGVRPVGYACHEDLPNLIERWTRRAEMTLQDHSQRVREIVFGQPPLTREDESYLEEIIADPVRVRFFVEHAHGLPWLEWIQGQLPFQRIFEPRHDLTSEESQLAEWFGKHYVADSAFADEALLAVGRCGGRLAPKLAGWVVFVIAQAAREEGLRAWYRWVTLLVSEDSPPGTRKMTWWLLAECDPSRDREMLLFLFDSLAEPAPTLRGSTLRPVLGPRADEVVDGYWFDKVWTKQIKLHLANLAPDLAPIIDRHLRLAHRIAYVGSGGRVGWKMINSARAAIEPQSSYQGFNNRLDPLIDAACDTIEALLRWAPDAGDHYLRSWSTAEEPLLRRIAVHASMKQNNVDADTKLQWLLDNVTIFDTSLQNEVEGLLESVLPHASEECCDVLVRHVVSSTEVLSERAERHIYRYLALVAHHKRGLESARVALDRFGEDHPDWPPPSDVYPFLPVPTPPQHDRQVITADELHGLVTRSPAEAVAQLTGYSSEPSGGEWIAVSKALHDTVKQYPADGLAIMRELVGGGDLYPEAGRGLAATTLSAWTEAGVDELPCRRIALVLPGIWQTGTARWHHEPDIYGDVGWLDRAINHWAGSAARVALGVLAAHLKHDDDGGSEIPDSLRAVLEAMLSGTDSASKYAQVVIGSQLFFLFRTDKPWCQSWVLPLLDPDTDPDRAIRCWDGYLAWGKFDQELLEAGLLDYYMGMIPLRHNLSSIARGAFYRHLADLALFSGVDPLDNGWLYRFTTIVEPEQRVRWIGRITERLRNVSVETAEAQWQTWMYEYWRDRARSKPRRLTTREASAMAEWTLTLGDSFPEAVQLAVGHQAGLDANSSIPIWLYTPLDSERKHPRPDYTSTHPEPLAKLLTHLLTNTETPSQHYSYLSTPIRKLRDTLDARYRVPLIEQALRLGVLGVEA